MRCDLLDLCLPEREMFLPIANNPKVNSREIEEVLKKVVGVFVLTLAIHELQRSAGTYC